MTASTRPDGVAPRSPAPVSASVEKRLVTYALVAGAGLLAGAKPADASLITVTYGGSALANGTLDLDLDSNGTPDFTIHNILQNSNFGGLDRSMWIENNHVNQLLGDRWTGPLAPGTLVGPGGSFYDVRNFGTAYSTFFAFNGNWEDISGGYLGLRFQISSAWHYGWMRLDVHNPSTLDGTIRPLAWAYEDVADTGVAIPDEIPEPGSLSLLALGAIGLAAWRRKRTR